MSSQVAFAQEEPAGELVRIEMTDGSEVIGTVVREEEDRLHFRTRGGVEMVILKAQISRRTVLTRSQQGKRFLRLDPNRTRLLFSPTARPLQKGHGYFAAYELFFPFVSYGLGRGAVIGGGISLIPGSDTQVLYFTPKWTVVSSGERHLAVGALLGFSTGGEGPAGLLYSVGTIGHSEQALTLGLGFAFADGQVFSQPIIVIGAEKQLSQSIKLITENFIIPGVNDIDEDFEGVYILTGAVRFFGDAIAADLGLITMPDLLKENGFPFIPWIGFAYNFGR